MPPTPPTDGAIVLDDGTVLPPMPVGGDPSVHAEMLAEHAGDPNTFGVGGEPTILLGPDGRISAEADSIGPSVVTAEGGIGGITALPNGMRREVLGFLPYWMLDDSTLDSMNYHLVSTIAYFSVGATSAGNLDKGTATAPSTGWAGWRSAQMTRVIDRAHAAGVRVVLTVTMMAWDSAGYARMRTLLTSSANRARLVTQIVDAVRTRGADGVNLDFEMVPTDMRAQYTSFVRQVKAALKSAGVGAYLTVCTTGGAATWATGTDVAALVASGAADHLFVMGYDFNWSGSARAGAVAPIDSPYVLDVSSAIGDFLERVPASKIIWGVPYYGRGWKTTTSQLNGISSGGSFSYYYTGHRTQAATYGRLWDPVGKVPWYRYYDSAKASWVQVYYDDAASLAVKYDLVNRHRLAGTGMWTLLMDAGRPELWRLLADKFVTDGAAPVGGVATLPQVSQSAAFPVSWKAIDYQSGLAHYNVQVRNRSSASWSSWLVGTHATSATYIGTPGITYEFRVQAVDSRGNAQPWLTAPGMRSTVTPGSFARTTTSLNVRSGAGTSYAALTTLAPSERVYVMSGPVVAGGLSWYQIQYGFKEWPSSEYALIGWAALGGVGESYLAPAYAPNITHVDPFIDGYARTAPAFSPNGDGRLDSIGVRYTLPRAVDAIRMDVVDAADRLVRRVSLPAQAAGQRQVTWDGRTTAGALAPNGRYLIKIFATDDGVTYAAPSAIGAHNVVAAWGITLDTDAPAVGTATPVANAALLSAATRFHITFDEAVTGLTGANVSLVRVGGGDAAATLSWSPATRTLTIAPESLLAVAAEYRLSLGSGITDQAGNPLGPWSIAVTTAPGQGFKPTKTVRVLPGSHAGYRIGAGGDVLGRASRPSPTASGAAVGHRASLPNLPGRWLHVENGLWAGMWLQESALHGLAGETERVSVPATTRLTFAAGAHTGYRYSTAGGVTAQRTGSLQRASGANVSARAIINGRPHWLVTNGHWAGWWVQESSVAYHAGYLERTTFAPHLRLRFSAGSHTGYIYSPAGARSAAMTATLTGASGAPASAWAVINGRPHYLVASGIWAGRWVPESDKITLAP